MHQKIPVVLLLSLGLTGCGGSGGTIAATLPTSPDLPAFSILSSTPSDGSTGVIRTTPFSATFSAAVDPKTINSANVQLLGPEGNVIPVASALNSTGLQFSPPFPGLPGNTKYTVNLASAITDISGRTLPAPYTRSFTTAAQSWDSSATMVASMPFFGSGALPAAITDNAGNVTAVWHHFVAGSDTIFASRMDGKSGAWSAASIVYAQAPGGSFNGVDYLSFVPDANGDAYLSWIDRANGNAVTNIKLTRYNATTNTWAPPVNANVVPAGASPMSAALVSDAAGNITFVATASIDGLFATRFNTKTGTWGTTQRLDPLLSGNVSSNNQTVVTDNSGNITAAWSEIIGSSPQTNTLYVARYSAVAGVWSAPQQLDNSMFLDQKAASMASDAKGVITIAWPHTDNTIGGLNVNVARFDPAIGSWTTPIRLHGGTVLNSYAPTVVSDAAGYSTVAWVQSDGLYSARFSPATAAWATPQRITPDGINSWGAPPVASVDLTGNITLIFVPDSRDYHMRAIQYLATDGQWRAPAIIDAPLNGKLESFLPVTVADKSGTITAVWFGQTVSADNTLLHVVMSNRFR